MKKFEEPKLNVDLLKLEDVITTSVDECITDNCSYETECFTD